MRRLFCTSALLLAVAVGLTAAPGGARAHGEEGVPTIMQALNLCARGSGQFNQRHTELCEMFIRSVHDTYEMVAKKHPELRRFCPPDKIEAKELRDSFVKWARKNPKEWQKSDVSGVVAAWGEAYPCK